MKTATKTAKTIIESIRLGRKEPVMFMYKNKHDDQLGLVAHTGIEFKPGDKFHLAINEIYAEVYTVKKVKYTKDVGDKYNKQFRNGKPEFNFGFEQGTYWMLDCEWEIKPLSAITEIEVS